MLRFVNRYVTYCLPMLVMCLWDATHTLVGQPKVYWQLHQFCNEANPIGEWALKISPWLFFFGALAWIHMIMLISLFFKPKQRIIVTLAGTLGHLIGAASWCWELYPNHVMLTMKGVIFVACLLLYNSINFHHRILNESIGLTTTPACSDSEPSPAIRD